MRITLSKDHFFSSTSSYFYIRIDLNMKNIGIICGGFSSEFEISVKSATTIYNNFPDEHRPFLVELSKTGWVVRDGDDRLELDSSNFTFEKDGEVVKIDAAIVYVHGDPGENGKVQAFLEMVNIPYINSGPLASQLSFDKWYCNQFLRGFGINVAKSIHLTNSKTSLDPSAIVKELGLPIFVKPCDSGSSYGIAKVSEEGELLNAISNAFNEGRSVVLESFLDGTEVTCGVYRTEEGVIPLPLTEIVTENEFFDYEAKYQGKSDEITPARISDELTKLIQKTACEIYDLLQMRSLARVDFMVVNGTPHVIEVNTTPGFSSESLVPKMLKEAQIPIKKFWSDIIKYELQ